MHKEFIFAYNLSRMPEQIYVKAEDLPLLFSSIYKYETKFLTTKAFRRYVITFVRTLMKSVDLVEGLLKEGK